MTRTHWFLVISIVGVILACGLCIATLGFQCYERSTLIPEAPIYPGSKLISTEKELDSTASTIYGFTYESTKPEQAIIDYYRLQRCDWWTYPSGTKVCDGGKAKPFGGYGVTIYPDQPEGKVVFTVGVAWDKCGVDFDHPSVER